MEKADVDFLVDLATRVYNEGQTQAQIARELGVDPSTVSRHLKRARDEGIVRIEIRRPQHLHVDLGRELADVFGLSRVIVADDEEANAGVAGAAATYLSSLFASGTRLGLSFGRLPSAVIHALPAGTVSGLDVSLLLGGFSTAGVGIQGHELARHVASLYPRSRIHYLQAPLLVDSAEIKRAMMTDGSITGALQAAASVELALVGIGDLHDSAPLLRYGHLSAEARHRLVQAGAAGDVCARFFRDDGEPVTEIDDRLMAIEREQLARIPTVIAVAAGPEKYAAIRGALRTGYVDVLVTDETTAKELARTAPNAAWVPSEGGKAS